ncbi:hypothetical protein C8J57DRAFT_1281451 [Mycena rebaudengoi]|nr:hypothetical protein C8J57DRAFT_1281451 [Mycena rebaudengoi]
MGAPPGACFLLTLLLEYYTHILTLGARISPWMVNTSPALHILFTLRDYIRLDSRCHRIYVLRFYSIARTAVLSGSEFNLENVMTSFALR